MKLDQQGTSSINKKPNLLTKHKDEKQKDGKKKQLIKRKRYFATPQIKSVNLKHIVNVSDIWFINQETLKYPQGSNQNIQRAMFRYKMISRIVLNSSFVGLELKKVDDNYLPPEYFFERFRSLGDRQIAEIANDLQLIHITYNEMQKTTSENAIITEHHRGIEELNRFLKEMEGKMYTIYFVEISKKSVNLKHIFFSVMLLQKLGWNIKRVASDFLKYRHVFFEIFSPKYYKDYIQICLKNYFKAQQLENDPTLTRQKKIELTTAYFDDEVVREVETQHGVYEEFLRAKVKFSCPSASFCCVEILSIDQKPTERYEKKKKPNEDLIEISPEEEITLLKKLGFQNSYLELDNREEVKEIKGVQEENGD